MSVALNQNKVQQQASISVMKLSIGVTAAKGDFIDSLVNANTKDMESSVQPNLGTRLDIRV